MFTILIEKNKSTENKYKLHACMHQNLAHYLQSYGDELSPRSEYPTRTRRAQALARTRVIFRWPYRQKTLELECWSLWQGVMQAVKRHEQLLCPKLHKTLPQGKCMTTPALNTLHHWQSAFLAQLQLLLTPAQWHSYGRAWYGLGPTNRA